MIRPGAPRVTRISPMRPLYQTSGRLIRFSRPASEGRGSVSADITSDAGEELARRRRQGLEGGGPERVAKIHDSGRQTARERIDQLVDAGSWYELGMLA